MGLVKVNAYRTGKGKVVRAHTRTSKKARIAALHKKIKWHMDRAGSGGSWHRAEEYAMEIKRLSKSGRKK